MYNRYIRNDNGSYEHLVQDEGRPPKFQSPPRNAVPPQSPPSQPDPPPKSPPQPDPPPSRTAESRFFNRLLDKIHLSDIDSGDLLLLMILFLLFRENADEELLIAIGLLLIL